MVSVWWEEPSAMQDHTTLTDFQLEVLTGLMLGDGHLSIGGKAINPRLRVNRALVDRAYSEWVYHVFYGYCSTKALRDDEIFDARYSKTYKRTAFSTLRHPAFLPTYQTWYAKGDKRVPSNIKLTPLTIAVWFADDGCLYQKHKGDQTSGVELSFATSGFSRHGSEQLADMLNERYEGGFTVYGEEHPKIMAATRPARRLLCDIDGVFPPLPRKTRLWRDTGMLNERQPRCVVCGRDTVYRNGRYTHNGANAQRFKCAGCQHAWKVPIV